MPWACPLGSPPPGAWLGKRCPALPCPAPPRGTTMGAGLSTGAAVAIAFNCLLAFLILILFLILCKACRTPSCPDKSPSSETDDRGNEERYLLQS